MLRELDRTDIEDRLILDVVLRVAMTNIPNCNPRRVMRYEGHTEFPLVIPIHEDGNAYSETFRITGQCVITFRSYYFQISDRHAFNGISTEEIILGYGEELGILAVANIHHVRSIVRRMIRGYDAPRRMSIGYKVDNSPSIIGGQGNLITGREPRLQKHR